MSRTLAIVGVGGLGAALAEAWAARGGALVLAGRDETGVLRIADDLRQRFGTQIETTTLDLRDETACEAFARGLVETGIDTLAVTAGLMPPEARLSVDPALRAELHAVNVAGPAALARGFAGRERLLVLPGSVAGVRVRPANRHYGASKQELHRLAERLDASPDGPRALLLVMGPLDTPMAWPVTGAHARGTADPRRVAARIVDLIDTRRSGVHYLPGVIRLVSLLLRLLPEAIVGRLRR